MRRLIFHLKGVEVFGILSGSTEDGEEEDETNE
jgi:hypothetical protein